MSEKDISPFEAFRNQLGKKPPKKMSRSSSEKQETSSPPTNAPASPAAKPSSFEPLFKQMQLIQDTFRWDLEKMCQDAGITLRDVKQYMENPANFTRQEWELLSELRARMPHYFDAKIERPKEDVNLDKELEKKKKSSSKKMLGQRKKWISM